jgi:Tfp pilus assembly protein PilP
MLIAALALGLGVSSSWADQQAPQAPPRAPKTAQPSGQKKTVPAPAVAKSAKAAVQRKTKTTPSQRAALAAGKRDPFKIPLVATGKGNGESVMDSAPGGALPPGVRGLLISQLRLEGVVRQQTANKMIAVVTNETRRAYFLHESDSVYNGVVSKITPDAIYFKENVLDGNGRVTTREVMKRLGSASGEGR